MPCVYQASAPSRVKQIDEAAVDRGIVERLVALFAKEDRDGHAPDALARDAPVGPGGDHVGDALLAPGRVPGDALDFVEGALAEGGVRAVFPGREHGGFHADEPLLGGAEDQRMVAAPAMRVLVLQIVVAHQRAAVAQQLLDGAVGLVYEEAVVLGQAVAELALRVHIAGERQVVALAGGEVVGAVRGCGVDGAGALLGGDVVGEDAEDFAVERTDAAKVTRSSLAPVKAGDGLTASLKTCRLRRLQTCCGADALERRDDSRRRRPVLLRGRRTRSRG